MSTKRIRVPVLDDEGYDPEIISKKRYIVVYPEACALEDRIFSDYKEAEDFSEGKENVRIEEVLLVLQIRTVFPKQEEKYLQ